MFIFIPELISDCRYDNFQGLEVRDLSELDRYVPT